MNNFLTVNGYFNTEIYRLENNGCPDSFVNQIKLRFEKRLCTDGKYVEFITPPGDFAPDSTVLNILNKYILNIWNYKTIAKYGTNTDNATLPVVFVNFAPSVENMSIYIFKKLKPIYENYNIYLKSVSVLDQQFEATFSE